MVYHTIVKSIARKNFEHVNNHNFEALLSGCTEDIKHTFGGSHALGGTRHDKNALRKWFQRLQTIVPGLKLTVTDVWVKGFPWDTTVVMRWHANDTFPDGRPYRNHGVHILKMKWAKAYEIDANEDSQIVNEMMQAKLAAGVEEALESRLLLAKMDSQARLGSIGYKREKSQ